MTATRVPIPAADQTWLHMDRPNNLMYVHSLMWFAESPDLGSVLRTINERVIDRYPVFSRSAVEHDGSWFWEDEADFDLANHVREVRLDGDEDALKAYVGSRFSEPFDAARPLWEIELIQGVEGLGTVMFSRFHHALADGIRLTQLMLSLCDLGAEDATPKHVGRQLGGQLGVSGLLAASAAVVRRGVGDAVDFATGVAKLPLKAVTNLGVQTVEQGWYGLQDLVLHPRKVIDLVEEIGSEVNASVNTITELSRMLTAGRSVQTAWSGTPGVAKSVSWVTSIDLGHVKELGRRHDGTVNDVLLALVSKALTRYLHEKDQLVDEIAWLVPVSLVPLDANLPKDLGNHFSLIFLPMPLGIDHTPDLLDSIRGRMQRIKNSVEPIITFGVQWVIAETPKAAAVALTNLFANKGVGVLTNVPGPRAPMTFAGVPVAGSLGWAPTSGDQPLSLCIFSYAGSVNIGIAADATLIPDPDRIAEHLRDEFIAMVGEVDDLG